MSSTAQESSSSASSSASTTSSPQPSTGSFLTKLSNTIETAPCFRVPLMWGIACGLAAGLHKFRIHRASPRTFLVGLEGGGKEASSKVTQDARSQSRHAITPNLSRASTLS